MSPDEATIELTEALLAELSGITDETLRARFLEQNQLYSPVVIKRLNDAARTKLRVDPRQSIALADAAVTIAERLRGEELLGPSLRAKANALYVLGDNQSSLQCHDRALAIFRRQANLEEEARTLNASIQPYILLGRYDRALEAATAARDLFERLGDTRRLAHVEINVGNLYHRQDRFEEALACYDRAYEIFLPFADSEGLGIALYNMSVCLISLNNFPRALASYQRARDVFVAHGMALLVGQADYNIAYLYYLRGEYGRAIAMLRAAREQSAANGDAHIEALCYLDLSDIYLELNLSSEAAEAAHEGVQRFRTLGMGYEEAKCLANEAIAWSQQHKHLRALEFFAEARTVFEREKNLVWLALIDLYRALALFDEGRLFEAQKSCRSALEFFDTSTSAGKAVLCHLLLSRIESQKGNSSEAFQHCAHAIDRLAALEMPILEYQAHYVMGRILADAGSHAEAYLAYQRAREQLEMLRSKLRKEELKIAFVKDKTEVYQRLVETCLSGELDPFSAYEAFQYIELAKHRSPAEIILDEIREAPESASGNSEMVRRLRELREELNWYDHRIELAQLSSDQNDSARVARLQAEARAREEAILHVFQDLPESAAESSLLRSPAVSSLETVQASLPSGVSLIEYFVIGDQLLAAVVDQRGLEILPVTLFSRVATLVQKFRTHLLQSRPGTSRARSFDASHLQRTQTDLRGLHAEIFDPLIEQISGSHLIFVPHGLLHCVPFPALYNGENYLIDRFTLSSVPSATVYTHCRTRKVQAADSAMVLSFGSADDPSTHEELFGLAAAMKSLPPFFGDAAALKALRESGPTSRWIHIANSFSRPKQEASSVPTAKQSHLNLAELYQLQVHPELISLCGFAPGLSETAAAADVFANLAGYFLESGAQSFLSTLWDDDSAATSDYLKCFYSELQEGTCEAKAFQFAVQTIRATYPHPYHWARFALSGDVLRRS